MRRALRLPLLLLLASTILWPGPSAFAGEKPYQETSGRRGWHIFLRPGKHDAKSQLAYADDLLQQGRIRSATRQYLALITFWPESTEAAKGQLQYARLVDEKGKLLKAFDEYQRLFERYTGLFPYDEVLGRQFEIARQVMHTKKGKFLFFPGFSAPERAIPLFQNVLTNGPQWEKAAESQFLIGQASEMSLQYEEAVDAYMTVQQRYPDSGFADAAAFSCAHCLYLLAEETPQNEQALDSAWAAIVLYLNKYPDSKDVPTAKKYKEELLREREKVAYDKAYYYDVYAKKPKAALMQYEALLRQFPHSDWTGKAQTRIDALKRIVGDDNDSKP